jgi:hypothetical protein
LAVEKNGAFKTMPELLSKNAEPDTIPLLLEQKLITFKEFLSATLLLKEHLLSEDMMQIDSVIDHRKGLMRRIDNLDNRIKNMSTHSNIILTRMASEKGTQIDYLSTALEELITKVIKLNEDCAAIATNRRCELGKELTGISNGRLALRGYAGTGGARDTGNDRAAWFFSVNV